MTLWYLTNSDFPTNKTFHQFHDLDTELDLHRLWVVSMEHLQLVSHASREGLPYRTPGSVPRCGICLYFKCWDQIPRTCHLLTRLFTSKTPWYFIDFAYWRNWGSASGQSDARIHSIWTNVILNMYNALQWLNIHWKMILYLMLQCQHWSKIFA